MCHFGADLGGVTAAMDIESHPESQQVKCVVVGDTGVGKTRLICAKACGTSYSLIQLMHTHVPTVWAIDHYRKDKNIYDRSWCTIDGVRVSLQLWDTFGYHDKDRKFAYGKADVVLVCFSTVKPRSLKNVLQHWLPEIQHHAYGAPLILCGNQIDLRYLYKDPHFLSIDKGPFYREISDEDIVAPDMGRNMSQQIGALHYYETSVLIPYGVDDVFENVMRVGLSYKREKHFWNLLNSSLKRVSKPLAQKPLMPPCPQAPKVFIPENGWLSDMQKLYGDHTVCDLVFKTKHGLELECHRIVLIAALPSLEELLCGREERSRVQKNNSKPVSRSSSSGSGWEVNMKLGQVKGHSQDTLRLLDNDNTNCSGSLEDLDVTLNSDPCQSVTLLNHPAFYSIEPARQDIHGDTKTVVVLNDNVPALMFQHVLQYMYTWCLDDDVASSLEQLDQLKRVAEMLGFSLLISHVENIEKGESFMNDFLRQSAVQAHQDRLKDLGLRRMLCSDITFEVEGKSVAGHKAILMVRSDMMSCMFSNNFVESSAKVIEFPGVRRTIFTTLLKYLYSGRLIKLMTPDLLELIELANQLCLPRVQALAEEMIIGQLNTMITAGQEIFEDVAKMLEPAQLHNATQLAEWCLWYLSCNYLQLYKKHTKLKQNLSPDNQVLLSQNRWPPVWYLKEQNYYEKCLVDYERSKQIHRSRLCRRGSDDGSDHGCLGFCSRRNRRIKYRSRTEGSVCV